MIYGRNSVRDFLRDTFLRPDDTVHTERRVATKRRGFSLFASGLQDDTRFAAADPKLKTLFYPRQNHQSEAANVTQHFIKKLQCVDFRSRRKEGGSGGKFLSVLVSIMTNHS